MTAFVAALNAERIKLFSTRSPAWSAAGVALLSVFVSMVEARPGPAQNLLDPEHAALGVGAFGVPVLMVLSALTVTAEYRSGLIRTTLLAVPSRTLVLIVKAVVCAVFSAVFTAAMVLLAVLVAGAIAGPEFDGVLSVTGRPVWRAVASHALYAALASVLAVGVAALLRHTGGTVAVLLLIPFVVEPVVGVLAIAGVGIAPLMPFANAYEFANIPWILRFPMWWGPLGSLVYFATIAAAVFAAGVVATNRRDA